jgi:hypothetical protein
MQFLAGINRQYRDAEADIDWLRSSLSARLTKSKADLINAKNRLKHRNPHLTERYRELEPLLTDLTKTRCRRLRLGNPPSYAARA